jgi:hypothetical protein
MSQLNWQNVAAPDFSGSLQGFAQFGQLLNQGFAGASKALDTYDASKIDEANKAAISDALSYTDPNAFNAALADGSFFAKHPTSSIDANTLTNLGKRGSEILDFQNKGIIHDTGVENLDFTQFEHGRAKTDAATADALKPIYADMAKAAADNLAVGGDPATLAKKQQEIFDAASASGALKGASADQLLAFYGLGNKITTGNQDVAKGGYEAVGAGLHNQREVVGINNDKLTGVRIGVETAGLRTSNAAASFSFENAKKDRRAQDDAALAMQTLLPASKDSESFRVALQGLQQKLSPNAYALVVQQAGQQFGGSIFADHPELAVVGAPSGAAAAGASNYGNYMQALESGGNPNAHARSSSAVGADQFTEPTWLKTVKENHPAWANGLSDGQILAQRTNPARSSEMESALRNANIAALSRAGLPTDDVSLYALHHFGAPAGTKFVAATGNTPVAAILTPAQIAANPYLRGLTKEQAINVWNQRAARFGITPGGGAAGFNPAIAAQQANSQRGATAGADRINTANQDTQSSASDIVNQLNQTSGFAKTNPAILLARIHDITQKSIVDGKQTITNAAAGKIIEDALTQKGSFQFGPGNLGNNMVLDEGLITNRINRAKHGDYQDTAQLQDAGQRSAAILAQAQARAAQSAAAVEQLQRDAATRGPAYIALNKDRILARAMADQRALRAAQAASADSPVRQQDAPAYPAPQQNAPAGPGWLDTMSSLFNALPTLVPIKRPSQASR